MLAPDRFAARDQLNPVLLPPDTARSRDESGATTAIEGAMDTPGETATTTRAALPSESETTTMSTTLPTVPAAYAPVVAPMLAPEPFVASDQTNPAPLPPTAAKVR